MQNELNWNFNSNTYLITKSYFFNKPDKFSVEKIARLSLFFSGSIYLIQLTSSQALSIWFITPLGGLFLIAGWITMIILFTRKMNIKL